MGVEHPGLALHHGILIAAKVCQTLADKLRQCGFGLRGGDGKVKVLAGPEVLAVLGFDKGGDLLGNRVRRDAERRWNLQPAAGRLTILGVIVPLPANRLPAIH